MGRLLKKVDRENSQWTDISWLCAAVSGSSEYVHSLEGPLIGSPFIMFNIGWPSTGRSSFSSLLE
jgi:hypothetical protein